MLVPAVLTGIFTNPCTMLDFFIGFDVEKYNTFADIFFAQSEIRSWVPLVIGLVIVPIIIIFISLLCGVESKHMRWGILSFKEIPRRINNNIMPVFKLVLAFLLLMQLYAVVCTTITFMWIKIFKKYVTALTLTIITNVFLFILLLIVFATVSLMLPIMSITGLNMKKAFVESMMLVKGKFIKILFAILLPLVIPYTIMGVLSAYFNAWWLKIVNAVMYLFIYSYYITFMYVTYCDIADIDREDLKNKYLKLMEG